MGIKETIHNALHQEEPHHFPLPQELEEGGLVGGTLQEEEMQPNRPIDLTPYEANQANHWEQRRRNKRVNGKR